MNSNKLFKIVFQIFLFSIIISSAYSGNVTYTDNSIPFYADLWYTQGVTPTWDSHIFQNLFIVKSQLSTGLVNTITYPNNPAITYTQALLYPQNTEDYILRHQAIDLNTSDSGSYTITQKKYRIDATYDQLDTTSCNINTLSFDSEASQLTVTSNLQPFQVYDWNTGTGTWYLRTADFTNSDTTYFTDLLNKYYHMKSKVVGTISYNGSVIETLYEDNMIAQSTLNNGAGQKYVNYSYIKPLSTGSLQFSNKLSYLRLLQTYNNYGTYTFDFTVTPIDFKCDLNENNVLETSEYTAKSQSFTLQIREPNTPTISAPTNGATFQGGNLDVTTTVSDPDANTLNVYFLVDGTSVVSQSSVASGSTITKTLTGLSDGYHNISVKVSDGYKNITSSTNRILMETPPVYSNIATNPANSSQYVKNKNYNFSIDWTDFNGISNVIFTFNGNTYTNFVKSVNTYTFTIPNLGVGSYLYNWFGNDTQSSSTTTNTLSYVVLRATPVLDLKLNGQANNIVVEVNENVTINASLTTGDIGTTLQLYEAGSLINSGTSVTNVTSYNTFNLTTNITVTYPQTANFSAGSKTFQVTTTDTIKPLVTNTLPNGTSHEVGTTINISSNVTDNYQVGSVVANLVYPNGTQSNLSLLNSVGNIYNNTFTIPLLKGTFNITIIATDHNGNINNTETGNFTTTDSTNPQVTILIPTSNTNYNTSDVIELGATVTDNVQVNKVIANLAFPNGTITNYTLTNVGSNKYNTSFTVPTNQIGRYNITIIANDTSNNLNNTQTTYFTVFDNINPQTTLVTPALSSTYYVLTPIVFSVNSSDNIGISKVIANLAYPNATSTNYTLTSTNGVTYNYTFTAPNLLGLYNLTFFVNDTSNNLNNTITSNFTINDNIKPNVTALLPTASSTYNITDIIELSANVTDNIQVTSVVAQLTYPNSTTTNINLTNILGNKYNKSFTIPNQIGRYNITIVATDNTGNINNTQKTNFVVIDTFAPSVTNLIPTTGTSFNISDIIELASNVTDTIAVGTVKAIIDLSNGTQTNVSLSSNGNKYNSSYTLPNLLGTHNITFYAVDSSGNINNTEKVLINVVDTYNPLVTAVLPALNSTYSTSNIVTLSADVTDAIAVDTVYASIAYPNGTTTNITLSNTGNTYNNTFTIPNLLGRYNITIVANDSSNNVNNSQTTYFNVIDTTKPEVTLVSPLLNSIFNVTNNVVFAMNSTDNIGLTTTVAQLTLPNGTVSNYTLSSTNSLTYNTTYTIPHLIGTYNLKYISIDNTGNKNDSVVSNFTVLDNVNPVVTLVSPSISSAYNVIDQITFSINATDNIALQTTKVQLDMPNGTITNYTLTSTNSLTYNVTFTVPHLIGKYNLTYFVSDSSGNNNNSVVSSFTVSDNIKPQLTLNNPVNTTTYNIGDTIIVNSTITDNIGVDTVYATIAYPNGTNTNLSLLNSVGSIYNNTFSLSQTGIYNITIYANDTSNNLNNTQLLQFNVSDFTKPSVTTLLPTLNSVYNITNTIELSANVTDLSTISSVLANLAYPNGTTTNITLSANGNKYNNSFTIPSSIIGTYNITIIATDAFNNVNNSEKTNFTVLDNIKPVVTTLIPTTGTSFNISDVIELSANVTDTIAVGSVKAIVDLSNGTQTNISLSSNGNKYNSSYTLPNLLGTHNITIYAVDSSGNINNTERVSINVVDTYNPLVTAVLPAVNTTYSTSNVVTLSADVTDAIAVSKVIANLAYPNGTTTNITLSNTGNTYNNTFTIPQLLGRYNITIIANDSSNNVNNTQTTYFNVIDTTKPVVTLVSPIVSSIYNVTNQVVFSANMSDNIALQTTKVRLDMPNGTSTNYTLTSTNSLTYNYTFTVPHLIGKYNLTYIAIDTTNNVNSSVKSNFTVLDNIKPVVTTLIPTTGTSFNISDIIELAANVTDTIAVGSVKAIVDLSNGTQYNITLSNTGNKYNSSYILPNLLGTHNITFYAIDSSGNINNTEKVLINVVDTYNPLVSNVLPPLNSTYSTSNVVTLSANVTDAIAVSKVIANLAYPNGTQYNVTLSNIGNTYNNTFTIPNLLGRYNVTIIANDSSNNVNNTQTTYFNVIDTTNPNVILINPNGEAYNVTNSVVFRVNATDNIAVSSVIAQLTTPNSLTTNFTMATGDSIQYSYTYAIPNTIGNYTLRFFVTDSSGNKNNTITSNFIAQDFVKPTVSLLNPALNSVYNVTGKVTFGANVADNVALSSVKAQLDLPNGTSTNYTLSSTGLPKFNYTYTIPQVIGLYNLTFIATDSSGNVNNSVKTNFTVLDNETPLVSTLLPVFNTTYNMSDVIQLAATATDNIAIGTVIAQVSYPNSTKTNVTLASVGSNKYNNTFTIPVLIGRYNITIYSNDTSGNRNDTETSYFNVLDNVKPAVTALIPANGSSFTTGNTIELGANVTDTIAVGTVKAQVTYPNSTTTTINLANAVGNKYNNTFTLDQNQIGNYVLRIIANDTSSNINNTQTTTFTITDITKPSAVLISPINKTYNVTNSVLFSVNATDNIAINNVYIKVNLPDNTAANYTLVKTGNTYNYTYTISTKPAGVYNITVYVNDTSGNINGSVTGNFTVLDNINPTLTLLSPSVNSIYNVTNNVAFDINTADNILVSSAKAQLDMPNGTSTNYTLSTLSGTRYNYSYTIPQVKGLYNLTYFVYDSSGNVNNTVKSNFTVRDNINPVLTVISPTNLTTYNYSSTINLIANVTDNIGVDSVKVNITLPNSTTIKKSLINSIGNMYNNTYITPTIGNYTLVYYINDTSSNQVVSGIYKIIVNDVVNPVVTNITPVSNSIYNISDIIEFGADLTDDIGLNKTVVQLDMPNGTSTNYTLTKSLGNRHNVSFTTPKLLGLYNLTYYANDTSNNINNSVKSNFTVNDIEKPSVVLITPTSNRTFNVSNTIELAANITENLAVVASLVQIDMPNGTSTNYTLTNVGSNKYNVSFTIPNMTGRYNVTFIANDSSSNTNNSVITYFNAIDLVNPIVYSVSPIANTSFRGNYAYNLTLNVTDNVALSSVVANITKPNGTSTQLNLSQIGSSDLYSNTYSTNNLTGRYNVTFTTRDTSGNNITNTTYFVVTLPAISSSYLSNTYIKNTSNVGIYVAAANYDQLYANVTHPNAYIQRVNLTTGISTLFSNISQLGKYNVSIFANDVANNLRSANYSFEVFDTVVFNSSLSGYNGSAPNGTYTITYNGTTLESGNLSSNLSESTINKLVAVLYTFNGGVASVKFNNFNTSQNEGKYFKVDTYNNTGGYINVLGVNSTYIFSSATVIMKYNPSGVSNENNLKLFYCSNYNFATRTCSSSYTDVTSSATLDTTNNKITFTATGFSSYAIKEVTPTTTSGSSGGGGGGGGGGGTTPTAPVTTPTDVVTVTPQEPTIVTPDTCTNDWVCTEWSPNVCPINGIQTRSCTNYGTCTSIESKPTEERTCSSLESKNTTLSLSTAYNVGVGVDEIVVNFSLSEIATLENLKTNDTITIVYQVIDKVSGEIVTEVVEATKVTEDRTISKSINTRDLPEGNYDVIISAIVNGNRYLSDGSSVSINGKDAYSDPLTGNIIVGDEFSVAKLIVGVAAIGAVLGLGYLGYMYQAAPKNYARRKKKMKFDWLKKK